MLHSATKDSSRNSTTSNSSFLLFDLFINFLKNRSVQVQVYSFLSYTFSISVGVPQGFSLSSIPFLQRHPQIHNAIYSLSPVFSCWIVTYSTTTTFFHIKNASFCYSSRNSTTSNSPFVLFDFFTTSSKTGPFKFGFTPSSRLPSQSQQKFLKIFPFFLFLLFFFCSDILKPTTQHIHFVQYSDVGW